MTESSQPEPVLTDVPADEVGLNIEDLADQAKELEVDPEDAPPRPEVDESQAA